jgi:hypothetical protein
MNKFDTIVDETLNEGKDPSLKSYKTVYADYKYGDVVSATETLEALLAHIDSELDKASKEAGNAVGPGIRASFKAELEPILRKRRK